MFGSMALWFGNQSLFLQLLLIAITAPLWLTLFGIIMVLLFAGENPPIVGETLIQTLGNLMIFGVLCLTTFFILFLPSLFFAHILKIPWDKSLLHGVVLGITWVIVLYRFASYLDDEGSDEGRGRPKPKTPRQINIWRAKFGAAAVLGFAILVSPTLFLIRALNRPVEASILVGIIAGIVLVFVVLHLFLVGASYIEDRRKNYDR
jgi:hypothetical protein